MPNMNFRCGRTKFQISALEFCNTFALVIDQNEEPDNQISIRFITRFKNFDEGDEFNLDKNEKRSIFDSLGIEVMGLSNKTRV